MHQERGLWGQAREARVLVLGGRGAGKTALVKRWGGAATLCSTLRPGALSDICKVKSPILIILIVIFPRLVNYLGITTSAPYLMFFCFVCKIWNYL